MGKGFIVIEKTFSQLENGLSRDKGQTSEHPTPAANKVGPSTLRQEFVSGQWLVIWNSEGQTLGDSWSRIITTATQ